jgi:hypothetical protein
VKRILIVMATLFAALAGAGVAATTASAAPSSINAVSPNTWVEVQGATVPVWAPNGTQLTSAGWLTPSPYVWEQCQRNIPSWGGYYSWVAVAPSPYKWGWIQNNALGPYVAANGTYAQIPGVPLC